MHVGVIFPQTEFGSDPGAIRSYAQTAQALGYNHILVYDHVLGADPVHRPGWGNRYTHEHSFHEPLVLFGFVAAAAPGLEVVSGVIILPQRQAVLVAKQAAEVDVLAGGRFRLGVGLGWNKVEYEALNEDFSTRARRCDEQIELMRQLWTRPIVNFAGEFHRVADAGLNPMPVQQPIPIWIGGDSEAAAARTARLGNGWIPHGRPDEELRRRIDQLHGFAAKAGRSPEDIGIEGRLNLSEVPERAWVDEVQRWRSLGVTHLGLNTMAAGLTSPDAHIDAVRRFAEAIGLQAAR